MNQSALLASSEAAVLSHGVAALAFCLLALLLIGNWRARQNARALLAACLATGVWALGTLLLAGMAPTPAAVLVIEALDLLRTAAWLVFLLWLLASQRRQRLAAMLGVGLACLLALLLSAFGALTGATACRLLLAVLGLLLVEQWYRNTPTAQRWGVKFACLGVGALFAYDFYLYSDALLLRQMNGELWRARGVADALCAPLLALAAARHPSWAPGLLVSRQMLLGSAAMLGAAVYLLAMAASAYYLRHVGGAWGSLMQMAFLGGAALLLVGMLFSGALRARLKVFINKHFYQAGFDYRDEWLKLTRALSHDGSGLAERAIAAMAQLVESPAGALWLVRDGRQLAPLASWNWPMPAASAPDSAALQQFLEARQWVIEVDDCRRQPQHYGAMVLPEAVLALPSAWLVAPLLLQGSLFGMVVLARPRTRISLNWETRDLLKIAGSQAASCLAHRQSQEALAVARQFESFSRMSTFVVHDLKNLVFQLSLLLANAPRHRANPAFQQDMLATLDHSVQKMKTLLQKLAHGDVSAAAPAPLRLDRVLQQAGADKASLAPAPRLDIVDGELTVLADRVRLERVLGHLLQNAIEATASDGCVSVRLRRENSMAVVELNDTGQGMSAQFIRERLFQPFDSTKTAGMGIGVFESREYLHEVGGRLDVHSVPAVGTTFRVVLPLHLA